MKPLNATGRDAPDGPVDLLYTRKWRTTLLVVLPFGFIAFLAALAFEGPSGQSTPLDAVMYPILATALMVLWGALAISHRALPFVLLSITAGVSVFFAGKLAWILFLLPQGARVQAEMTENFFWIPAIYLLSFILPQMRLGRHITMGFTLVVLALGFLYVVPNALQDRNWGVVYALVQMNLANTVFFALTSAFTSFKEEYTRTATRMEATERFAYSDALTALPNRHDLQGRLETRLRRAREDGGRFALMFIDVDGFKGVNDALGHAGGDVLLQEVAARLRSALRGSDVVARISGDEFVVIVDHAATPDDATAVAERVMAALADPIQVQAHALRVSVSIGISLYPDDAQDADTLLRHADSAMYHVKRSGRNGVRHYLGEPDEKLERQRSLERDLRAAIPQGQLSLAYQSLHDLASGDVRGFEALLRWRHPTWGDVSPADFIPLAEQSGLIVDIGAWVLDEACRQATFWQRGGLGSFPVSVNVSPLQFSHPGFVGTVLAALNAHGLAPELLELEVTESVVLQDVQRVAATLAQLQALGIRIAIDDFGTGYSSLAYLRDLPIDTVKIDRSFVRDLGRCPEGPAFAPALVEAIVGLAAHLDLEVVAEGIETDAQADIVRALGCRTGQGYLFSRPMTPEGVAAFLGERAGASTRVLLVANH